MMIDLKHGDCLELLKEIPAGSVDLILTDPPYGNMNTDGGRNIGIKDWDKAIDTKIIFNEANRLLKQNGKLILFSQEPYSSKLVSTTNMIFNYRLIWEKDNFANPLGVNSAPVNFYEDIMVFSSQYDFHKKNPLRGYFKNLFEFIGLTKKCIIDDLGGRADHTFRYNSSQFELCSEETYNELIHNYSINKFEGFIPYNELKAMSLDFKSKNRSTFNLPIGQKYKSNILKYKKDYDGYHPTQKPVALLEDLINTFSNAGDHVLDFTMGSGSTGVACVKTGRKFTGIEKDSKYFKIAE